jgi:hypothetical protein
MIKHHPDYPVINAYKRLQKDIYWFINMLLKVMSLKTYKVIKHNGGV